MADENSVEAENPNAEVVGEAPKAPKPKSRTRKKSVAIKPTNDDAKSDVPATKAKRYSSAARSSILASVAKDIDSGKTTLKAALKTAGVSEQTYYKWKRDADKTELAAATPQSDALKDLVALEAENHRLRKELADKLRAENAELRRRLAQL